MSFYNNYAKYTFVRGHPEVTAARIILHFHQEFVLVHQVPDHEQK